MHEVLFLCQVCIPLRFSFRYVINYFFFLFFLWFACVWFAFVLLGFLEIAYKLIAEKSLGYEVLPNLFPEPLLRLVSECKLTSLEEISFCTPSRMKFFFAFGNNTDTL